MKQMQKASRGTEMMGASKLVYRSRPWFLIRRDLAGVARNQIGAKIRATAL
jgi:hypothetical protein